MRLRAGTLTATMILALTGVHGARQDAVRTAAITPARATAQVAHDADDPAIWIDARHPERSLILGTDKFARRGGLYVFGLDGTTRQVIAPLDRPNNVDVEYGVALGGRVSDVAVVTERKRHCLRIFRIPPDGGAFVDLAPAGIPVLQGQSGEASEPMGVALYRRPSDGAFFAFVTPKTGGTSDYVWQYLVDTGDDGLVRATLVRRFGAFSGRRWRLGAPGEIEAIVVDDAPGFVYYADERFGIRKYLADPDAPDAARELAAFATTGYEGEREGLAIYVTGPATGYLLSSDQVADSTRLHVYPREGEPGKPHSHPRLAIVPTRSDATDGMDAVALSLPGHPRGFLVMMTSGSKRFLLYDWDTVAERLTSRAGAAGALR